MASYGVMQSGVQPVAGDLNLVSSADNITATASGTQISSAVLTGQINRVVTVATAADGVKLPPSVAGATITIINAHATKPIQVFGTSPDTIDGVATGTGVSQMARSTVTYTCATAGAWTTESLGQGYGTYGLPAVSYTNAITAFAGGGQASGVQLVSAINRVTTVASAADSVKLPAAVAGMQVTVINAAAANATTIYPASGEIINALSADAGLSVAANKTIVFNCAVAGTWNSILTA